MILFKHLGYELTGNVFAKNNKFSKEMNPAPLFSSNIHEHQISEYVSYATKELKKTKSSRTADDHRWIQPEICWWISSLPSHFFPLIRYQAMELLIRVGSRPQSSKCFLSSWSFRTVFSCKSFTSIKLFLNFKKLYFHNID